MRSVTVAYMFFDIENKNRPCEISRGRLMFYGHTAECCAVVFYSIISSFVVRVRFSVLFSPM